MQSELQKRIFANVLLNPNPEHVVLRRRQGISISTMVSIVLAASAAIGLVTLLVSRLQGLSF